MHVWILHEEKEGNIFFMNINEQTVSRNLKQIEHGQDFDFVCDFQIH